MADSHQYSIQQGEACQEITPLTGDITVESLYDYNYPMDRFQGPPGSDGVSYSSEGTVPYQLEDGSILFLYEGPDGLSLVVVHGRASTAQGADVDPGEESPVGANDGDGTGDGAAGGDGTDDSDDSSAPKRTVSFAFQGLPEDGEWVVADDYYLTQDGEPAPSNYDRWQVDSQLHAIHWAYRDGRTDGGAFRDLGEDIEITLAPAFNETAGLADEHYEESIDSWEVLSGDTTNPDRYALDLTETVVIRSAACQTDT